MKLLRTLTASAVIGVAALAGTVNASATIIPKMSVEQVYDASDIVVHGRVIAQRSQWENIDGNRLIFTYSDVEVYASLKSNRPARNMTVRTVGGEVNGYNQALIGEASIRNGEEVVLFLGKEQGWKDPAVVGFYQGKYAVDHNAAFGSQLVRDQGTEAGTDPRLDRIESGEDFLSELNRIATRTPELMRESTFTPLTKRVNADEMTRELQLFARTIERGTHAGDINADGVVDLSDVTDFADAYVNGDSEGDVDNNGVVDITDLQLLIDELNR